MLGERFRADGEASILLSERQMKAKERFIEECNNILSPYQYETYRCECGATEENFEVLAEKDRYGLDVRTVICRKCGLVMTNPRLTQESYDYFYDMEYGKLYRNQDKMDAPYFMKRVMAGKAIYDFINQNNKVMPKEILEIGCAAGGILYFFKEQGCNVTGVDLGSAYIEYGRALGLNLLNCHSSELKKQNKKYDLIILNHVFEHFLDIEKELDVIKELLTENGILYIAVPGIKALVQTYNNDFMLFLQNAHVYHFTLRTLEQVMNKYGFELLSGTEEVRSIFKYTGNCCSMDRNYYTENMRFLFGLEDEFQKRRIKK